jgi:hypothetical protein
MMRLASAILLNQSGETANQTNVAQQSDGWNRWLWDEINRYHKDYAGGRSAGCALRSLWRPAIARIGDCTYSTSMRLHGFQPSNIIRELTKD